MSIRLNVKLAPRAVEGLNRKVHKVLCDTVLKAELYGADVCYDYTIEGLALI